MSFRVQTNTVSDVLRKIFYHPPPTGLAESSRSIRTRCPRFLPNQCHLSAAEQWEVKGFWEKKDTM